MRKMNCDTANKMVRRIKSDLDALLHKEAKVSTYSYLSDEDPLVPEYNFQDTQDKISEYTRQIVALKHAINQFNVSTTIAEIGLTIDGALVRMAILNNEKMRLDRMRNVQDMTRATTMRGISEYTKRNYEVEDVEKRYCEVCDEIMLIQQGINMANLVRTFEVDI